MWGEDSSLKTEAVTYPGPSDVDRPILGLSTRYSDWDQPLNHTRPHNMLYIFLFDCFHIHGHYSLAYFRVIILLFLFIINYYYYKVSRETHAHHDNIWSIDIARSIVVWPPTTAYIVSSTHHHSQIYLPHLSYRRTRYNSSIHLYKSISHFTHIIS